jgi:microcystin-dependent protein
MSVRTIEASSIRLAQINAPDGQPAITVSQSGVVSLVAPSGDAGNEIASTTYVQEAIANATGTLSLNTTGSYQWTGNYQVFNNDQIITIGNNLTEPPTFPVSGETCDANQTGIQFDNNLNGYNETDFLNYAGDQTGGYSFSTITDSYPLKQNLEIKNNGSATILNVLGEGSDIQVNSESVLVPDPASQTLQNNFSNFNTFDGTTVINGPLEINNPSTVTDVMTFEPNTIKLINPTYPVGIGQVLLGPQGNIQLLNNQSTKGVTIQSGTYATSMLVDNLSNLNLRNGLVVTSNVSASNITSTNNISTNTMTITGIATAPTAPVTTNTDQLATCAFVIQNQSASTGAEVGFPNTFTATQTFQANSTYPTNMIFSKESVIPEASISYDTNFLTIDTPDSLIISNNLNDIPAQASLQPYALGLNLNGSPIINETALNTALSAYPTTASLGTTFAQLTGATFTGNVITPSISATTGSINNSPIVTNATITPALSGYAQLSSADFTGTITAPTIRSSGAISCLSGTINGFPIVSKNNLDTALAGYASKTADNTLTGVNTFNPPSMPASVLAGPSVGAGVSIYWNTDTNSGATDLLCNGNGGRGGLNIWANNQTLYPPAVVARFYPDASTIYGTLNITNPTNSAFTVGLESDASQTLNVIGDLTCRNFGADGATISTSLTSNGTTTLSGASTCPNITIDDKYPTSDIVNARSLINYVNSQTATSQYFVGQLINGLFPSNSSELLGAGFLYCNGDPLDYTNPAYTALYNVIGINYGTSGGTTFWLPDFTGKMAFGGNIEQGFGVPVPQFLNQDTSRNEQYSGVYGGYVQTGDFPFHSHSITDNGHSHSANVNYANFNTGSGNTAMLFNNQGGTPQFAMNTNGAFTGITQTNISGSSSTIGVLNPYCSVNYFIYAGVP